MKTKTAEIYHEGREKISSITVLSQFKEMLEEDIRVLRSILEYEGLSRKFRELVSSLINTKEKMLRIIKEPHGVFPEAVAPPQRKGISSHRISTHTNFDDEMRMCSIFHKIELDQMQYLRHQVSRKGIPEEIYQKMNKILSIYSRIETQLKRIVKTKQINALRT